MIAVIPLLAIACGGADENVEADVAAIQALIADVAHANNAGDITGWVELFTDDGIYLPDGRPAVTNAEGLEGFAVSHFSRYRPNIEITAEEVQVLGDWAFARTRVTGTLTPRGNGNPIRLDGKELAILRRGLDGGWKIARLIGNSSR